MNAKIVYFMCLLFNKIECKSKNFIKLHKYFYQNYPTKKKQSDNLLLMKQIDRN